MRDYKDILIKQNSTIKEALSVIDSGNMKIALIVDENEKLIGTITDGDIRRGLLKGLSLESDIEHITHKNPTIVDINSTKEEILHLAISKNISQIPVVDENGKVFGIYEISDIIKPEAKSNRVVLMVGGLGTRLRPLTNDTPKPMLKVGDKPILQTIVEQFRNYGFTKIIMCVNYKSEIIKEYFKDGSNFGVEIKYVDENKRMGTAGALSLLEEKPTEPFFVMNGDLLTNLNFENLHSYHMAKNSIATMCVRKYEFQVPYGVINVNGDEIVSIEEKPVHKFFVNAGIYMLSPEVLNYIPKDEFFDMPTLFDKLIGESKSTFSFPIREYWMDIGRLEEYKKANKEYGDFF